MKLFKFFKRSKDPVEFSLEKAREDFSSIRISEMFQGGNGRSAATPVVISAKHSLTGVFAQYAFLQAVFGTRDVDYTQLTRGLCSGANGKKIYMHRIRLKNGEERELFFDVTSSYGKP